MLGALRRHASSWLIKSALALIVVSFALFFGYNRQIQRYRTAQNLVARVGDQPISRLRYGEILRSQTEKIKESLKGELPANVEDLFRSSILEQLVTQEVSYLFASELGLRAPDSELAREIRSLPPLSPEGLFEPRLYEAHRRSYRLQFGEEFEEAMRREVTLNRLADLAEICFGPWEEARKGASPKGKEETISPEGLMSPWIRKFREEKDIKLYPNPSG